MRNGIVAALLVLAILAGTGAGYLISETNPRTITSISTTTATTTVPFTTLCSTPVSPTTTSGTTDVYEVSPGSLGNICVEYHFDTAGNWSFATPGYGPLSYGPQREGYNSCAGPSLNGTEITNCASVRVTSSVGEFSHGADQNVSVTYTIATEKNTTGLFWLFIGVCDPIYFAMGSAPASVSGPTLQCISVSGEPSYEAVNGVSNIAVSVVPVS